MIITVLIHCSLFISLTSATTLSNNLSQSTKLYTIHVMLNVLWCHHLSVVIFFKIFLLRGGQGQGMCHNMPVEVREQLWQLALPFNQVDCIRVLQAWWQATEPSYELSTGSFPGFSLLRILCLPLWRASLTVLITSPSNSKLSVAVLALTFLQFSQ